MYTRVCVCVCVCVRVYVYMRLQDGKRAGCKVGPRLRLCNVMGRVVIYIRREVMVLRWLPLKPTHVFGNMM